MTRYCWPFSEGCYIIFLAVFVLCGSISFSVNVNVCMYVIRRLHPVLRFAVRVVFFPLGGLVSFSSMASIRLSRRGSKRIWGRKRDFTSSVCRARNWNVLKKKIKKKRSNEATTHRPLIRKAILDKVRHEKTAKHFVRNFIFSLSPLCRRKESQNGIGFFPFSSRVDQRPIQRCLCLSFWYFQLHWKKTQAPSAGIDFTKGKK